MYLQTDRLGRCTKHHDCQKSIRREREREREKERERERDREREREMDVLHIVNIM
jgi:hypothetical protein